MSGRSTRHNRKAKLHAAKPGWRSAVVVFLIYGILAIGANWHVWVHGVSSTIQTAGGSDVQEEVWFLAQTPWAIIHGVNPFANAWLNAPTGLNLMDNTTMPLLGILGAPITLLFGPIATFNVLLDLGFCVSAGAFFLAARRHVAWTPAAFIGGLLYGFSPYAVAVGTGHLFLLFSAVPPLVLLVVDRFVRSPEFSPRRTGLALGLCLLAQLYISVEIFASMIVLGAITVAVAAVVWWRPTRVDIRRWLHALGVAGIVLVVGASYPLWVALAGPQHIQGPAQTAQALAGLATDPLSLVVPTINQHFTLGHASLGDALVAERNSHWDVVFDAVAENGTYIGVPLIVLLTAGTIVLWQRKAVRLYALVAMSALVLSMGSRLHIDGHRTRIPLPFIFLAHLPLLDSSVAVRYMLFFWLFAALILAIVADRIRDRMLSVGPSSFAAASGAVLVSGAALIPLLPQWPYSAGPAGVPTWFTTQASTFPVGSTLVIFPFAEAPDASAMLWQAVANVRFKMPGGYAVFRSASGSATFASAPSPLQESLALCSMGEPVSQSPSSIRSQLASWHASGVLVAPNYPGASCARHLMQSALGLPREQGGMLVWRIYSGTDLSAPDLRDRATSTWAAVGRTKRNDQGTGQSHLIARASSIRSKRLWRAAWSCSTACMRSTAVDASAVRWFTVWIVSARSPTRSASFASRRSRSLAVSAWSITVGSHRLTFHERSSNRSMSSPKLAVSPADSWRTTANWLVSNATSCKHSSSKRQLVWLAPAPRAAVTADSGPRAVAAAFSIRLNVEDT